MKKDYSKLDEVIVTCQEEMDDIPNGYAGGIYIDASKAIMVRRRYYWSVVAKGNSLVVAKNNSSVEAWDNSSVVARADSSVGAYDNSSVVAFGCSLVGARDNASVVAYDNASVVAYDNASVVAMGNAQVIKHSANSDIKVFGNARIVYPPRCVKEYLDIYGVAHTEDKAILYKAVRKIDGNYVSDYKNDFTYEIGKTYNEDCDKNTEREYSYGLHVSFIDRALRFGIDWENLAILEVEVPIDTIVLPDYSYGVVRTSTLTVLREVPLEECGMFGKILAKRRSNNGNHKRN